MTIQETKEVLATMTASFPKYFSNVTRESAERQVVMWHEDLGEYSQAVVMAGQNAYRTADSSGFPPTTGQVISYIHMVGKPADKSGTEAWALVRRAVNCPWDQMEASFNTLPKIVQKAVGSAASLKELAQMDIQTFETVAQSNFLRMYDAAQKREATEQRISNSVIGAKDSIRQELETRRPEPEKIGAYDGTLKTGTARVEYRTPDEKQVREPAKPSGRSRAEDLAELRRRLGA